MEHDSHKRPRIRDRPDTLPNDVAALGSAILNSLTAHVAVLDRQGTIVEVNDAWRNFSSENASRPGHPARRTGVGVNYLEICRTSSGLSANGAVESYEGIQSVLDGRVTRFSLEYPCHSPTEKRWFLMDVTPLSGAGEAVVVMHTNITQRKMLEEKLIQSANVFHHSRESIVVTDADGTIVDVNPAFSATTGYSRDEVLGKNPRVFKSGRQDTAFYRAMWNQLLEQNFWTGEIWNVRKNGEAFLELLTITTVRDAQGVVQQYVGMFSDITQRKALEIQVHQMAYLDALTRLPNRRVLEDRLSQAVAISKRSRLYGALIFLDLDNFKPINDTYGHAAGDLLLIEVGQRLTGCLRERDSVARIGGDEFAVLLGELDPDETRSREQAGIVAEKIRVALALPYRLTLPDSGKPSTQVEHRCTASIGVVLFVGQDVNAAELQKRADAAMYKARESQRNAIRFWNA